MSCMILCVTIRVQAQGEKSKSGEASLTADDYFEAKDYLKALKAYREIEGNSSASAILNYRIGVCMYNLKDQRSGAGVYFERATFGIPQDMYSPMTVDSEVLESYYYLGQHYHAQEEFDIAITM